MARAKRQPAEAEARAAQAPVRRHPVRKFFKYLAFCLLGLVCAVICALIWLTQTGSGQAWAVRQVNSLLAPAPDAAGLGFRITNLAGSVPFDFEFGLESSDRQGVWLIAPQNRMVWNWRELPGCLHITQLALVNVDVSRLPDVPEQPEPAPPARPFALADMRAMLNQAGDFLAARHWWLPDVRLAGAVLEATLPQELVNERPLVKAALDFSFVNNAANASAKLAASSAAGGKLTLPWLGLSETALDLALQVEPDAGGLAANCELKGGISGFDLAVKDIPQALLGDKIDLGLKLTARASAGQAAIDLAGPDLTAGKVKLAVAGNWASDSGWQANRISGPLACNAALELSPLPADIDSPLKAMRSPASLNLAVNGDLPALDLNLRLGCAEIALAGHAIADTDLSLSGAQIQLPLDSPGDGSLKTLLAQENRLRLNFATRVDKQPADLSTQIFFQNFAAGHEDGWRVGLRDLALSAFGLAGGGNLAAVLGASPKPALDGSLHFAIRNWDALAQIVPRAQFSGQASLDAELASGLAGAAANPAAALTATPETSGKQLSQNAALTLAIPAFAMRQGNDKPVELAARLEAELTDLFGSPALRAKLDAGKILAAGLRLSAAASASGSFAGPLVAEVNSKGDVVAQLAATWRPGRLDLQRLAVQADLANFMAGKKGRKMLAGLRATQPARFFYGDAGYRIEGLDLRLLPGGRLTANGALAPDKLNLSLNLLDLNLKSLAALVPDLPSGSVQAAVNLKGTPERPAGDFRIGLNKIAFPGSPLAPATLALLGEVTHGAGGGALKTRLEINPETVRALGGTTAQVAATLPLLFGKDGIPTVNMQGPFAARVVWDGALGPIWNLLPLSGRRLNGRVKIDAGASGTLAKPAIRGMASLEQARYEDLLLGILLTDINLKLDLAQAGGQARPAAGALDKLPGAFKLALSLSDGRGGTVTANGSGGLDGEKLDIKARINDLKPLRRRDIHVQLSGDMQVTGSATAPLVAGEIIVDKGEVLLNNLAMTGSVTTLDITSEAELKAAEAAAAKASAPEGGGRLNVRVRMLPRFSVEGRGLASLWQCNLLISGPLANPQVTGAINSVRGNFDFLGKVFALTKGRVFFGGGSLANPLVDVELTYDTPDLVAHIMVAGPVNKIRLTMTSDPVMPRDEIISRVLFGRSVNDLSRMEALQLAGAVAQLAGFGGGAGLLGAAKKALGVDVLRIGTANTGSANQSSDDTGGGTTLEMGKYINDYTYMGVQQGFKADSTAFIIEIELSHNASLELRTEQGNTWGGIRWRKNY